MQETRHQPKSIACGWVKIDLSSGRLINPPGLLSAADQHRAGRFRHAEDRLRFVAGRILLAALLHRTGESIAVRPLELALSEHGRPYLPNEPGLAFSISHAGEMVAVALTRGARVGLDLERIDRQVDLAAVAARIFSPADLARFNALPAASQSRAFFHAWTGKEAVLKARGIGLFGGLAEIAAPLEGHDATLSDGDETWHLRPLPLPGNYAGCVACDDPGRDLLQHTFRLEDLL